MQLIHKYILCYIITPSLAEKAFLHIELHKQKSKFTLYIVIYITIIHPCVHTFQQCYLSFYYQIKTLVKKTIRILCDRSDFINEKYPKIISASWDEENNKHTICSHLFVRVLPEKWSRTCYTRFTRRLYRNRFRITLKMDHTKNVV